MSTLVCTAVNEDIYNKRIFSEVASVNDTKDPNVRFLKMMINDNTFPTERARHIDVRYFQLQDWRIDGDIIMVHIKGILNISDAETKPLGFVLHSRHCRRMMGHYDG